MITNGWAEWQFPAVIDFQEGPGILAKDFRAAGVPLVRLSGLDSGTSVLNGCDYLDPDMVAKKWAHFGLKQGDILLSTSASLGRVAIVGPDGVGAIPYTGLVRMRPRDERLHAPFIRYLLAAPAFQHQIEAAGVGSVIKHFGPMHLRGMKVQLPPPKQQEAIAAVLGSLDERIELNRRMSQTLEAIAQAIFKSWFFVFEHDWPHAEWQTKSLDSVADYLNGLALQKYPPIDGEESLPVIKIAQLRAGHTKSADRANQNVPPPYVISDGDLLFSWSGSLEVEFWCGGNGALNQHLFKVTSSMVPSWYAYMWTKHHLPEFRAIAANKATTMGHIQRKHLTEAQVLLPPPATLEAMDAVMKPIFAELIQRRLESRTLDELRDELLPKLMSGELIPGTERATP